MASQTYSSGSPTYGPTLTHGNTSSGSGTAHNPPKKKKAKGGKRKGAKRYEWDNGTMHTRRQGAQFRTNADQPHHAAGGPAHPPAKPPVDSLTAQAQHYGRLAYNPQINAIKAQIGTVDPYFQDYVNKVTAAGTNYTNQSTPVLQQAQQTQTTAGTVTPGTEGDPEAQLAAQSRAALTGLGLTTLQGIVNSNQGYFAGQAGPVAAAGKLQMKTDLDRQLGEARQQRGEYVASKREELRETRHKDRLENQAFGLDVAKASQSASDSAADNRRANRQDRQNRRDKAGEPNKYGFTDKEWRSMTTAQRQKEIRKFDKSGGTSKPKYTPQQVSKTRTDLRKGIGAIKRALEGKKTAPADFWNKAYNDLLDAGYDPLLARAAIQTVRIGTPGANIARRLKRDYGLTHLPRMKPLKKPPAYVLRPVTQAPGANGQQRPT